MKNMLPVNPAPVAKRRFRMPRRNLVEVLIAAAAMLAGSVFYFRSAVAGDDGVFRESRLLVTASLLGMAAAEEYEPPVIRTAGYTLDDESVSRLTAGRTNRDGDCRLAARITDRGQDGFNVCIVSRCLNPARFFDYRFYPRSGSGECAVVAVPKAYLKYVPAKFRYALSYGGEAYICSAVNPGSGEAQLKFFQNVCARGLSEEAEAEYAVRYHDPMPLIDRGEAASPPPEPNPLWSRGAALVILLVFAGVHIMLPLCGVMRSEERQRFLLCVVAVAGAAWQIFGFFIGFDAARCHPWALLLCLLFLKTPSVFVRGAALLGVTFITGITALILDYYFAAEWVAVVSGIGLIAYSARVYRRYIDGREPSRRRRMTGWVFLLGLTIAGAIHYLTW